MAANRQGKRWLSRGFEELAVRAAGEEAGVVEFDVVIVGSGYGGAIAAHHFSGQTRDGGAPTICVLERGNEYLEGMFPAEFSDLPGHVRFSTPNAEAPRGNREGLFDFRVGPDVSSLVANGLGGGSLINAGVMLRPPDRIFAEGWPKEITAAGLDSCFEACERLLEAKALDEEDLPDKFASLACLGPATAAPITVAREDRGHLKACNDCGNCATGCNFGAKASLDVSLLADAQARSETLECFTGATVLDIEPEKPDDADCAWILNVTFTEKLLRKRYKTPTRIRARHLIVAAGTFGSTELLMRSARKGVALSARLGERFSTNGDMLAVGYDQNRRAGAIATSAGRHGQSLGVGPTITGFIDRRDRPEGILIEEMAVPFAIREIFQQVFATAGTIYGLNEFDWRSHRRGDDFVDALGIDTAAFERTSVYAMMGDDDAEGRLRLSASSEAEEGLVTVDWPCIGHKRIFREQMSLLERETRRSNLGGRTIANPVWRAVPESLGYLTGGKPGPAVTVHPLGGCAMADNGAAGVVDHLGRAFTGTGDAVYGNLVVLDGSIVPGSLCTNPALTISALALRAAQKLSVLWGFRDGEPGGRSLPPRPTFVEVTPRESIETEVALEERLIGDVRFQTADGVVDRTMEITLSFEPTTVAAMTGAPRDRKMKTRACKVRLFRPGKYEKVLVSDPDTEGVEAVLDKRALAILSGDCVLDLFHREASSAIGRIARAGTAWLLNRGVRDIWQALAERRFGPSDTFRRIRDVLALANRSGEKRALTYRLDLTEIVEAKDPDLDVGALTRGTIVGRKIVTYRRTSNPLRQMMEIHLIDCPMLDHRGPHVLTLDPRYLARIGVPLMKLCRQQDTPRAIQDLLALGGYFMRMMLSIHAWTFRLPDRPTKAPLSRLPGKLPGVPVFEQYNLDDPADGKVLPVVVTRYRRNDGRPLMMLHGYSASGTTFAHESLRPSAAAWLWKQGWDVWVVDFRTSPGQPTSVLPWTFEQVADCDIPVAVDHIYAKSGGQKISVVAHCMGSAMFSMAVLAEDDPDNVLRTKLRERIERVVLTQVGPGVVFSPANIFRAFILNYLKYFMELSRFDFRVDNRDSLLDQFIDRLLNVLPYPASEFKLENPAWPPWKRTGFVGIRHRMDLLYGRDFSLGNVTPAFLDNIDAMFGPLNLDTVSQAMHFTRWKNITTKQGNNVYYLRERLRRHWRFPTLSLHGEENGLSSLATLARNKHLFRDADVPYKVKALPGFGHQDIWVSEHSRADVFPEIHRFLTDDVRWPHGEGLRPLLAAPPFLGPILVANPDDAGRVLVKAGKCPNLSEPESIALVPVMLTGERYAPAGRPVFLTGLSFDEHGMTDLVIDPPGHGGSYLLLLLYDEHPALLERTFGDPPFASSTCRYRYQLDETADRREDAIARALEKSVERLSPAVLPAPDRGPPPCIAFASCQYPPGLVDKEIAYASWRRLRERLDDPVFDMKPGLTLLLGDQVYVDSTAGLFDPRRLDDRYGRSHVEWLSNDAVQSVLSQRPTEMMLDDHEIENDWEPLAYHDDRHVRKRRLGEAAFRSFQVHGASGRHAYGWWGEVKTAPVPVFMLNSRTTRDIRRLDAGGDASMISRVQWQALQRWLTSLDDAVPKVVTLSSLPMPRHVPAAGGGSLKFDGMDGYPRTLHALLRFVAEKDVRGLVLLSGDEHMPVVSTACLTRHGREVGRVLSIHTSALYSPFEFVNGRPVDLIGEEEFDVGGTDVRCRVTTQCYPADNGFTLVDFARAPTIRIRFEGCDQEVEASL